MVCLCLSSELFAFLLVTYGKIALIAEFALNIDWKNPTNGFFAVICRLRVSKKKPNEHMLRPKQSRCFVYEKKETRTKMNGRISSCNYVLSWPFDIQWTEILTRAKPALCAPCDSMYWMYFGKSLNSSHVGRNVWIFRMGSSIAGMCCFCGDKNKFERGLGLEVDENSEDSRPLDKKWWNSGKTVETSHSAFHAKS